MSTRSTNAIALQGLWGANTPSGANGLSGTRFLRRWCSRRRGKAVAMVETAEDGDSIDWGSLWRPRRGQVSGAVGRLQSKSAVGPAMVVGQVVVENALGMFLVFDDIVVEAVPAEGADHALAEGIGRGRARWCGEESGAESSDAAVEVGAIDRVSVVDEESGDLLGIAGCLRDSLGGPAGGWMLGDAGLDDGASAEGKNDEDVKEAESRGDEDEEVAGPGLVQVVTDERGPALAMLSFEVGRAVLCDCARGNLVAELGQLGGDDLLTPGRVLAPHPPDEFAEICVDGRTAG